MVLCRFYPAPPAILFMSSVFLVDYQHCAFQCGIIRGPEIALGALLCPIMTLSSSPSVKENILGKADWRVESNKPYLGSVVDYGINISYSERKSVSCNGLRMIKRCIRGIVLAAK
ncbi:jg8005 [Pararge aegeria aegeria]|nr:jg8005 [Pararge aegeria aegeria]